jgi:hypothetical protein
MSDPGRGAFEYVLASLVAAFYPGAAGFGDLPSHVTRVEMKHAATRACKSLVTVALYPSYALLSHLAAMAG